MVSQIMEKEMIEEISAFFRKRAFFTQCSAAVSFKSVFLSSLFNLASYRSYLGGSIRKPERGEKALKLVHRSV